MGTLIIDYALPLLGVLVTALAQWFVTHNYNKYKCVKNQGNLTGAEVASRILKKHNINNVKICEISGELTDHYDPTKKVVNLSHDIHSGTSIASVSVAAHECGHVLQDKYNYTFLKFRSMLVPIVNFSTKIGYLVVMIGLIFGLIKLAWIGIILLLAMLLFQLVTLPVEFNASSRALKELQEMKLLENYEVDDSKSMLTAAAFTYVAGMLSTLLQILRLALTIVGRRDD